MAIIWKLGETHIGDGKWGKLYGPARHTHIGRVVETYTREFKPMSDIYADKYLAVVVNDDGTTETIEYSSNFDLDNKRFNYAVVDTLEPELRAKYDKVQEYLRLEAEIKRDKQRAIDRAERAERERNTPVKGKRMEVVRGRKVKKGTVGVVFWVRDGRVGLDVTGKKDDRGFAVDPVWVDAGYLKAVS